MSGEPLKRGLTRELVRDPCEIIFEDGRRFATQRWITRYDDIRDWGVCEIDGVTIHMTANLGWVDIGPAFPTPDSLTCADLDDWIAATPPRPWWRRVLGLLKGPPS